MSCNRPQKSWRRGKKRVVKACSGGKERIIHYGAIVMSITIAPLHVVALELDINAVVLEINYPLVIGHVKIYGLEEEIDKDVLRIENVSGQDAGQDDVDLVRGQEVDRLEDQEDVSQDVSQDVVDNNFSDLGIF